ncbi:putative rRNA-processing protein [Podospora australis]|uniref:U three protein 23 n=1 Tax=Podospora australis TaxID=1536484 RepID=A0AAN7ANJ9_9PEZI|nr:putative rRNA-processing protein [Podospora australis]
MGKRTKQYKKLMRKFQLMGFREPYQLLMTSDIVQETMKLDLLSLFEKTLSTKNLKPMITQCCIRAMYEKNTGPNREPGVAAAIERAKTFERRRCGHLMDEKPLTERECMMSVVDPKRKNENKFRYIVATQDELLREKLRSVVPTPLMYVKRSVLILEPMAAASQSVMLREERAKFKSGIVRGSQKRKREDDDSEDDNSGSEDEDEAKGSGAEENAANEDKPKKKKKNYGKKQPNPLAMKKARRAPSESEQKPKKPTAPPPAPTEDVPAETKAKRKRRKKNTTLAVEDGPSEGAEEKEKRETAAIEAAVAAAVQGAEF